MAAVALLGVGGCAGGGETEPSVAAPVSISLLAPDEFAKAIADPARIVINVHVPFEGALPGTDMMIPFNEIERRLSELPSDRTLPIAVYCMSGRMSADAARALKGLGFADIVDLDGGMRAWQASGRTLAQSAPGS
ncbi:rhodanese-like domain-containing protein [Prauserella sp. PE36]|uniref:Sulfurtransferase n=3 Tax=Pseudonocardiaceae TaxID=2070 RepID=A0A318L9C7_9PSEU|nr:sulfurtransferase [Prauserella flavalba]PXY18616.1 sulfurtransferase [Prauserella coralliicola]RBM17431.1 rhodanese-like domain-containing protein [Prauserella sp. PE36]TKG63618.1 rhodanese-like domain-containing protein [Prauserella endophytica]